jgi:hypothetical protein
MDGAMGTSRPTFLTILNQWQIAQLVIDIRIKCCSYDLQIGDIPTDPMMDNIFIFTTF